ncbi:MAG: hypothetical protein H6738_21950 [Alphaproteobacteria bacterium]|nr:hypothetical protein [Alphaproteobacteria bacterium]MCB9699462.1 hypothetical protein [Alphaproteobacteria bacterium]
MPRPPRSDPPGTWHLVTNRGAGGRSIFEDEEDQADFLALLGPISARNGVELTAYALASTDFHLLVRSWRGRLSETMRQLQQHWTQLANRRHGWDGPLFHPRFTSRIVEEGSMDAAFEQVRLTRVVAPQRPVAPSDVSCVLDRVQRLTGSSLDRLRHQAQGPAANPARRFAVWALRRTTDLTQAQVGELLHMSTRQVQNVEHRLAAAPRPPLDAWVERWGRGEA